MRIRYLLGAVLLFTAINAFAGGVYGLSGAEGVPPEWLEGSPFSDYSIPSAVLFIVVGGACALASLAVLRRTGWARQCAFVAGVVLLAWIAVQLAIIGYVSWLQPASVGAAGLILLLTWLLPNADREPTN